MATVRELPLKTLLGLRERVLIWATARPSALGFYRRCGLSAGEEMRVQPTNARMRYVWFTRPWTTHQTTCPVASVT